MAILSINLITRIGDVGTLSLYFGCFSACFIQLRPLSYMAQGDVLK